MPQVKTAGEKRYLPNLRDSALMRVLLVGFLVLLLKIPVSMIDGTIQGRAQTREHARLEVVDKWGKAQSITGPFLVVPYKFRWTETNSTNGRRIQREQLQEARFLPETLAANGDVKTELRHRGLFDFPVYRATLSLSGRFARPDFAPWAVRPADILWDKARLVIAVADPRALQDHVAATWNGKPLTFLPGTGWQTEGDSAGVQAPLAKLMGGKAFDFTIPLSLNGSESLALAPVGKQTDVLLRSNWPHPSFTGGWLPKEHSITDKGFEASWSVSYFSRSFPQALRWQGEYRKEIAASQFGVNLLSPVDSYRASERIVKYAALFVGLTFLTLWLFEVLAALRVHPLQYLLIGSAMCLFYLLQLSLSEHIGFGAAYASAASATTGLVASYCLAVLKSAARAAFIATVLAALYGYLYVLLQLEDYSLLIGSVGLFLALALVMYVTRKVDWSRAYSGMTERTA